MIIHVILKLLNWIVTDLIKQSNYYNNDNKVMMELSLPTSSLFKLKFYWSYNKLYNKLF